MYPFLAIASMLLLFPPQGVKPQTTPRVAAETKPIVLGTQQLPGDFGKLGQAYTLGRRAPVNVTLRGVAYGIEAFAVGNNTWVPRGDEKLLLLSATLQNPNPQDLEIYGGSLRLTAVDQTDTNRVALPVVVREGTNQPLSVSLKPAQKIDVVWAILVPASGVVPKLIIEREPGTPVLRYDLRGQAKPLPEALVEPGDATKASVRARIPVASQSFAPLGVFDVRVDSTGKVDAPLLRREAGDESYWYTVILTLRNRSAVPQTYNWSDFVPELIDSDGEKPKWTEAILKATRDEVATGTLAAGEEARIRLFYALPKGATGKTLTLAEAKQLHPTVARRFVFTLPE